MNTFVCFFKDAISTAERTTTETVDTVAKDIGKYITPTINNVMVEREWQHITESLPMMCLILDHKGHIVKTINSDRHSTRFFPEAQQGQTLNELFGIDSFDNYVEAINKTLNTGKAHQQTIAYATANGTRWFDTFITKMRGDLGISSRPFSNAT